MSCENGLYKLAIQNRLFKIVWPHFLKRGHTIHIQKIKQSVFALN